MRDEKLISFAWRCYGGEVDFVARLVFWSTLICTREKCEVHAIYAVQCLDVSFSDGRKFDSWAVRTQLCDQVGAVFHAMWHHDLFDVRAKVEAHARARFADEMAGQFLVRHLLARKA